MASQPHDRARAKTCSCRAAHEFAVDELDRACVRRRGPARGRPGRRRRSRRRCRRAARGRRCRARAAGRSTTTGDAGGEVLVDLQRAHRLGERGAAMGEQAELGVAQRRDELGARDARVQVHVRGCGRRSATYAGSGSGPSSTTWSSGQRAREVDDPRHVEPGVERADVDRARPRDRARTTRAARQRAEPFATAPRRSARRRWAGRADPVDDLGRDGRDRPARLARCGGTPRDTPASTPRAPASSTSRRGRRTSRSDAQSSGREPGDEGIRGERVRAARARAGGPPGAASGRSARTRPSTPDDVGRVVAAHAAWDGEATSACSPGSARRGRATASRRRAAPSGTDPRRGADGPRGCA